MTREDEQERIAVIGMAGKFPGAGNIHEFWENLCSGKESISFFSTEELLENGTDAALVHNPNYIKARGILGRTELWDAAFFGLNPKEAALMDPQHRLFLECAWDALETSGYCPDRTDARIGVFAGESMNTYLLSNVYPHVMHVESPDSLMASIGNDKDSLTTEAAYRFNLKGPAVTIQSSSSTSLVAVHYACQSLLNYECDITITGGVSIHFPEKAGYLYHQGGITSPDGHCRTFDARAGGFVAGHGAGVVVLKRLSEALQDRDFIWAIIRGSAVNNDGSNKVSYMAPSVEGQAEVIAQAQVMAGVEPRQIGYVEAHGTGTLVGDPIEVAALTQAFHSPENQKQYCALGAVKANIGHLDSAAGVTGLIKTILILTHKKIPPQINFKELNPKIDFGTSPFFINTRLSDWDHNTGPRIAGVSSFGMGGTNAHMIVEEAPENPEYPRTPKPELILLSAKTGSALHTMTENLAGYIQKNRRDSMADIAYTLQVGRRVFPYRRAVVCGDPAEAAGILASKDPGLLPVIHEEPKTHPLIFMFPGEGPEHINMGRNIYEHIPFFRQEVDKYLAALMNNHAIDLRPVLFPPDGQQESAAIAWQQTSFSRTALLIIECALAALWRHLAIKPDGTAGSGTGEYAAACCAGIFSVEEALALITAGTGFAREREEERTSLLPVIKNINFKPPRIPFISHLTGTWITEKDAVDPEYWIRQATHTGSPSRGIDDAVKKQDAVWLEIGPGSISHYDDLLKTIGNVWSRGFQVDWEKLYPGEKRKRIPVPTYPYERQKFWVEPNTSPAEESEEETTGTGGKSGITGWFYTPAWKNSPLEKTTVKDKSGGRGKEKVLVFCGSDDSLNTRPDAFTKVFLRALTQTGCDVFTAFLAFGQVARGDRESTVNPQDSTGFRKLVQNLKAGGFPEKIILMEAIKNYEDDDWDTAMTYGLTSVILFLQALENEKVIRDPLQIISLTTQAQEVSGGEHLCPEKTLIPGLGRVAPQEYPNITWKNIDIILPEPGSYQEKILVQELLAELGVSENNLVAYRGNQRWVQTYEKIPINPDSRDGLNVKENGVYIIVGGSGTIGYAFAQAVTRLVKARLIIIGSTELPGKEAWEDYCSTHPEDDRIRKKILKLKTLEENKATVHYFTGDVTNLSQMEEIVHKVKEKYGEIHGVIHSAGTVNRSLFTPIKELSTLCLPSNFYVKTKGLYVLREILKNEKCDFCLLASSLASFLGGLGLAAYAASNSFMDSFARSCNRTLSSYWLSINWDAWEAADTFFESGENPLTQEYAITTSEGVQAIEYILRMRMYPQIAVSTRNLRTRIRAWYQKKEEPEKRFLTFSPRPNLRNEYVAPRNEIEEEIALLLQELLGITEVGVFDNFFELGGNSLIGLKLIDSLNRKWPIDLHVVSIYEGPNIDELGRIIMNKLQLDGAGHSDTSGVSQSQTRGKTRRQTMIIRNRPEKK